MSFQVPITPHYPASLDQNPRHEIAYEFPTVAGSNQIANVPQAAAEHDDACGAVDPTTDGFVGAEQPNQPGVWIFQCEAAHGQYHETDDEDEMLDPLMEIHAHDRLAARSIEDPQCA